MGLCGFLVSAHLLYAPLYVPPAPPLISKYLEPQIASGSGILKSTGRALMSTAAAILRNKTLTATTAAAIATALSLYYLYTHPEETSQMVEKIGVPLAGTAAAVFAERMLPSGRQPQPYPVAAVARRPVPQVPSLSTEQKVEQTQQDFKKAFEESGLKTRLEEKQQQQRKQEEQARKREQFEQTRRRARLEELARRRQEKAQEKTFEEIWRESQGRPKTRL